MFEAQQICILLIVEISSLVSLHLYHEPPYAWPRASWVRWSTHIWFIRDTLAYTHDFDSTGLKRCQFTLSSMRHHHVFEIPAKPEESCLPDLPHKSPRIWPLSEAITQDDYFWSQSNRSLSSEHRYRDLNSIGFPDFCPKEFVFMQKHIFKAASF